MDSDRGRGIPRPIDPPHRPIVGLLPQAGTQLAPNYLTTSLWWQSVGDIELGQQDLFFFLYSAVSTT